MAPVKTAYAPSYAPNEYLFPLRENLSVKLLLPKDLKMSEVAKLTRFMEALVTR